MYGHRNVQIPKWLILLIAVAALAVIWQVARANGVGRTCGVTALGAKLCGNELRAWCDATEPIRAQADTFGPPAESVRRAREICAKVR